MTVHYSTVPGQHLTEEEKDEVRNAKKMPLIFDDDCPELSPVLLKSLKAAVRNRNGAALIKKA